MENINHCEHRCDCNPPALHSNVHNKNHNNSQNKNHNKLQGNSHNNSNNSSHGNSHNNSHGSPQNHSKPNCPHWCEKCCKCHKEPPPHKKNFLDGLDNEKLIMLVVLYMFFKSKDKKDNDNDNDCEKKDGKDNGIDMKLLIALAYVFM
ncbi:MAG: hypothetical protein LBL93_06165 [Ruminococcus sp.]|jgi:hypothetical protein|nr:hypothetical protein [Ruminococcus sp.]